MYELALLLFSFTAAHYDKLDVGDDMQTVADLLGPATAVHYEARDERCLIWNDRDIGIDWPKDVEPILSAKDRLGLPLGKAEVFA